MTRRATRRPDGRGPRAPQPRAVQWRGAPPPPSRPARLAAYDLLRAVRRRARTPTSSLPQLIAAAELDGRDAAFATELAYGTLRRRGFLRRGHRRVRRPAARARSTRRCSTCCASAPTSCCACACPPHAAVGETVELARRRGRRSAVALRQRRAAPGRPSATSTSGSRSSRRTPARDPVGHLAVVHVAPALGRGGAARRAARPGAARRPGPTPRTSSPPTTSAPSVTLVARPGLRHGRGAARAAGTPTPAAGRRTPCALERRRARARSPAVRAGASGVQDEGSQLVALALAARRDRGPRQRAGSTCAPAPAARRRCSPASALDRRRDPARGRAAAAPGRAGGARRSRRAPGPSPRSSRPTAPTGRGAPARFDRVLRRRPVHRARRAAPPPGGALAAHAGRRRRARPAAARAARLGAGRRPRRAAWSPTSPARRTWPRPRGRGRRCRAHAADVERVDARPLLPEVDDLGAGPDLQLWPHVHGTDAMYLALLRRTD